ncbi:MAG: hypothetical protein WBQ94_03670 [Terracidiphilus sp.]
MSYPRSNFEDYFVTTISRKQADPMIKSHYLHRWPGVCVLTLGMWKDCFLVGAMVFALPPRETSKRYGVTVAWELARLYILDSEPFNSETWFMGRGIKHIKRYFPFVQILVSYADPSAGHLGKIYEAGNWEKDGRTDQERKTPRFDYAVSGRVYSRRSHVPENAVFERIPRVSKFRYTYRLK